MKEIIARILSSKIINTGPIGKIKNYLYFKFISDNLESKTDEYRAEILNDFMEIYKDEDWILAFGSFLKFYRDNTMNGQDIDILIRYDDYCKGLCNLQERGYRLSAEFSDCHGIITEHKLKFKNVEIDIFFVIEDNDKFYGACCYADQLKSNEVERKVENGQRIVGGAGYYSLWKQQYDFESQIYEFQGMKFKGYKHPEESLEAIYGNWRTPDPNYNPLDNRDRVFVFSNAKATYYLDLKDLC